MNPSFLDFFNIIYLDFFYLDLFEIIQLEIYLVLITWFFKITPSPHLFEELL